MYRGSAVASDNNTVYIAPGGSHKIYHYQVKEDVWSEHQIICPHKNFGLAVFGNELTTVGGEDTSGHVTGNVLTFRQGMWIKELPPLTWPRSDPAVVSTDCHLLSIGGHTGGDGWCSSVELLHKEDRAWTSLTSLPTTTFYPSVTLIRKYIYIMAEWEQSFFSSISDILANKKPLPPLTWHPLPSFPPTVSPYIFTPSSCSLGGQLVIVVSDDTVYQLLHGKWEKCGHLSGVDRHRCILASPSPHTMVAVGASYYVRRYDGHTVDVCISV